MTLDRTSYQGETIGVEPPGHRRPGRPPDRARLRRRHRQTGARKPATTETGLVVTVPMFVKEGDTIRVDNLAANPAAVVTVERENDVIIPRRRRAGDGLLDRSLAERLLAAYRKYVSSHGYEASPDNWRHGILGDAAQGPGLERLGRHHMLVLDTAGGDGDG